MNEIAAAAELALKTCPKTSWTAQTTVDYDGQRLSFGTMKGQLIDEASRARAKLFVMLTHWALTGAWPQFRNAPVYFLNEVLRSSAAKKSFAPDPDFPTTPPPWEPKHAARFLDRTALLWYSLGCDRWAAELATEDFELQERHFAQMHPLE
jgi:hypothetical protein